MITVLLAAYQGEAYIREQLDSILNQTVPGISVLISDDGSADGTWDIIEEYTLRYPGQVRGVRRCPEHAGAAASGGEAAPDGEAASETVLGMNPAAANFFRLLARAEGDYILLSDQDDVWNSDKVERLLYHMEHQEKQWGKDMPVLLYSDAAVVDGHLSEIAPSFLGYQHINPDRNSLNQILVENPVTGGAVMMNAALLALVRQAPETCVMHDWWLALTASCFGRLVCVGESLYQYRQHGNNTLGARKTGDLEDLKRRIGRGKQVEAAYCQMFAQAQAFLEQFDGRLNKEQTDVLLAFLALPHQGPIGKMKTICRNHFYKSSVLQTAAQCFTMPRLEASLERSESR